MDKRIDIDAAAQVLRDRLAARPDLTPSPLTWMDFGAAFDEPLSIDRPTIREPYSVGVEVRRGAEEGRLVLFAGGWADYEFWLGTAAAAADPVLDAPGWDDWLDVERFGAVVDRLLGEFAPGPEAGVDD